jgi:hypothetical protein
MTGQSRYQKLCKEIEELGGKEYVFERFAGGDSMKTIAEDHGFISGYCMDQWRRKHVSDDEWAAIKEMKAEGLVHRATERLENFRGVTSAEATITKKLSEIDIWQAGKLDRKSWGDQDPQVAEAVSSLADTWRGMLEQINRPALPAEDADYELLETDEPGRIDSPEGVGAGAGGRDPDGGAGSAEAP